ncbi:MAG: hypothetical protein U0P30_09135 [Vicinamibacterales bacterium]
MKNNHISQRICVSMLVVALGATAFAQKGLKYADKITVFVRSGPASATGFTDPSKSRSDSVKDLRAKVAGSLFVRPVATEGDAVIVLEVLDRETKSERTATGYLLGNARQNKSTLSVRMTVGEFTADFEGEAGNKGVMTGYADAAGKVVDQIEVWVKANLDKLTASKK